MVTLKPIARFFAQKSNVNLHMIFNRSGAQAPYPGQDQLFGQDLILRAQKKPHHIPLAQLNGSDQNFSRNIQEPDDLSNHQAQYFIYF